MSPRHEGLRYRPYRDAAACPNIVVDGAPLPSTVLTLSHWPNNATPEQFRRETSTETVLAWVERHDPRRIAGVVTNNHFDEDGLFSMFALLEPGVARRHGALLADAARAGDFGTYRNRDAARLCFAVEAHADPRLSPLPASTFTGTPAARVAALYRRMLPRVAALIARLPGLGRWWRDQDRFLADSEALVAAGRVAIEEEPDLDLAIVRMPDDLPLRPVWRYLGRERARIHPFAIHNATRAGRLVRIAGRSLEFQYRYESWLKLPSRRPALRVDLSALARWLNRRERHGRWIWEDTLDIAPRLYLAGGAGSSLPPAVILGELRRCLRTLPVAWDPYDWPPGRRRA